MNIDSKILNSHGNIGQYSSHEYSSHERRIQSGNKIFATAFGALIAVGLTFSLLALTGNPLLAVTIGSLVGASIVTLIFRRSYPEAHVISHKEKASVNRLEEEVSSDNSKSHSSQSRTEESQKIFKPQLYKLPNGSNGNLSPNKEESKSQSMDHPDQWNNYSPLSEKIKREKIAKSTQEHAKHCQQKIEETKASLAAEFATFEAKLQNEFNLEITKIQEKEKAPLLQTLAAAQEELDWIFDLESDEYKQAKNRVDIAEEQIKTFEEDFKNRTEIVKNAREQFKKQDQNIREQMNKRFENPLLNPIYQPQLYPQPVPFYPPQLPPHPVPFYPAQLSQEQLEIINIQNINADATEPQSEG